MARQITFYELFSDEIVDSLDFYGVPYNQYATFSDETEAYLYRRRVMAELDDAIEVNDRENW